MLTLKAVSSDPSSLDWTDEKCVNTDIMECMATSDNVVRAGLTPKLRDVPTLVDMLTYTWGPPSTQLMSPEAYPKGVLSTASTLYDPPIEEFSVVLTDLISNQLPSQILPAVKGPGILICTALEEGSQASVTQKGGDKKCIEKEGQMFFIGANTEIEIEGKCITYTAFVES